MHGVGELERPPCKTLIPPFLHHEKEHNGPVMFHVDSPQQHIQEDAMHLALSKEKNGSDSPMSSNSDVAPRQQ